MGQERALLLSRWQLLGGWRLVGDAEGGEETAQEGHQAGEVHGTAGTAHSCRQRPHGQGHEDLRQEVLAAQQGDVNAHPTPRALRLRAYELRGTQCKGVQREPLSPPWPGAHLVALVVVAEQGVGQRAERGEEDAVGSTQ